MSAPDLLDGPFGRLPDFDEESAQPQPGEASPDLAPPSVTLVSVSDAGSDAPPPPNSLGL